MNEIKKYDLSGVKKIKIEQCGGSSIKGTLWNRIKFLFKMNATFYNCELYNIQLAWYEK